jgi:hypothetical protein
LKKAFFLSVAKEVSTDLLIVKLREYIVKRLFMVRKPKLQFTQVGIHFLPEGGAIELPSRRRRNYFD